MKINNDLKKHLLRTLRVVVSSQGHGLGKTTWSEVGRTPPLFAKSPRTEYTYWLNTYSELKKKVNILLSEMEKSPSFIKNNTYKTIFFNVKNIFSHTLKYYIDAKYDRISKLKSLIMNTTSLINENNTTFDVVKPSQKKIVLKYDKTLLPDLIHDDVNYAKYIESDEFKKMTQTEKKMYIELSNSHKYLNCKPVEEVVCGINEKEKTPPVKPVKPKPVKPNLKKQPTPPKVKMARMIAQFEQIYQPLVGIISKVEKDNSKLNDKSIVNEYNKLRKNLKVIVSELLFYNPESIPVGTDLIMDHTLNYIIKKGKAKTFKKKSPPKNKTIKSTGVKPLQNTLVSPIYKVDKDVPLGKLSKHVKEVISKKIVETRTPSINKELSSVIDLTPYMVVPLFNMFGTIKKGQSPLKDKQSLCKSDDEVYIEPKPGKNTTFGCLKWNDPALKQIMLDNFKSSKTTKDCDTLVGPKQYLSNCWFNTFFMAFFISDHSQKFFKHLRQIMIEGKNLPVGHNPNKPIDKKIVKPMFLLNCLIDACLSGNVVGALNTNVIIDLFHKSKLQNFVKTGKAYNPISFYTDILRSINHHSINIKVAFLEMSHITDGVMEGSNSKLSLTDILKASSDMSIIDKSKPTDVFIIESASISKLNGWVKATNPKNKALLNSVLPQYMKDLQPRIKVGKYTYVIDSVVLRDNSHAHFSCFFTCNNKEKWFDGAGLNKPVDFKWKDLINKNIDINDMPVNGPRVWKPMKWNFIKGYFSAFYYREK